MAARASLSEHEDYRSRRSRPQSSGIGFIIPLSKDKHEFNGIALIRASKAELLFYLISQIAPFLHLRRLRL